MAVTLPSARVEIGPAPQRWELLPFRFHRLDDEVLLTNMVGESIILDQVSFLALTSGRPTDSSDFAALRARHFVRAIGETLPLELLALKTRTRYRLLADFTRLHIFVVTLRCDHTCNYCQVSRQNSANTQFDMSFETATAALEATFRSPAESIKIEFQGGEPLLNFALIRHVVIEAEKLNDSHRKNLSFVIASNLSLLDAGIVEFCSQHDIYFSTSIDGPVELHNHNRPRPGNDSWQRTLAGVKQIRDSLGHDRVGALMTTTRASLPHVRDIIDTYVEHGFTDIFLRPISPYGFAARAQNRHGAAYNAKSWLSFYEEGLDYILDLNAAGLNFTERFAAIALCKMLTNDDPGYIDLTSPAGIGIAGIVYNYDGDVYASDEGRMLAEMGDTTFRLGNLGSDSYETIMTSDALLDPIEESFAASAPMCSDCAFECYCGADPVYHHATSGDYLGRKPDSEFCGRNMGIFTMLLQRYRRDAATREVFQRWAAS